MILASQVLQVAKNINVSVLIMFICGHFLGGTDQSIQIFGLFICNVIGNIKIMWIKDIVREVDI